MYLVKFTILTRCLLLAFGNETVELPEIQRKTKR